MVEYQACPPVSPKRLEVFKGGRIKLRLKTPYSDGSTHVIMDVYDFMSRLKASFDFLPMANPTGARLVKRHNSANFDLNRNFSQFWMPTSIAPGPAPFSERETQLIRTLFQENNYNVAIDIENFY